MSLDFKNIVDDLPYDKPFLFVDELLHLDENGIKGSYTFKKDEFFYSGHFKGNPITPGVILIECMAQIGLVSFGIYMAKKENRTFSKIAFSSANVDFLKMVLPGEKVWVESTKKYFRFGKLSCDVVMKNSNNEEICRGNLSGMLIE